MSYMPPFCNSFLGNQQTETVLPSLKGVFQIRICLFDLCINAWFGMEDGHRYRYKLHETNVYNISILVC